MQAVKNNAMGVLNRALIFAVAGLWTAQVLAADLNVCAGENEMPFSNDKQEGFENAIALSVGKALNRKVNFIYWKDPRYAVRDFLDKGKCDVLLGLDAGDPRVLTTAPYYKSAYVFITRRDRDIAVTSWNDPTLKDKRVRIGVLPDSPGKDMLLQLDRFDDMFDYLTEQTNYQSTRNKYVRVEPSKVVNDVALKKLHVGVLWGPEAARYVGDSKEPLVMRVADDDAKKSNGQKVPMHYEVVMGVAKGNTALRDELNRVIAERRSDLDGILQHEGIPLLPLSAK